MTEKIYRVNMATLTAAIEDVPEKWKALGGRGLTSIIVAQEVKPTCNPLGKYNKLIFAPGLLTGTMCANSGRLSAGAKSPLTGTIKESNAGGTAAQCFAGLGVKALIIEGLPEKDTWYNIHVDKNGVAIQEETELVGKKNYEVMQTISKKHGEKIGILSISFFKDELYGVSKIPETMKARHVLIIRSVDQKPETARLARRLHLPLHPGAGADVLGAAVQPSQRPGSGAHRHGADDHRGGRARLRSRDAPPHGHAGPDHLPGLGAPRSRGLVPGHPQHPPALLPPVRRADPLERDADRRDGRGRCDPRRPSSGPTTRRAGSGPRWGGP